MNDMSRAEWPLGPRVDSRSAERPQRTALVGRLVTVAPLDPARHGDSLYGGLCGAHNDDLWCYLLSGPFGDRASFDVYLEKSAVSKDPLFFSILDGASARALGIAAYLRVEPLDRVIEVGSIVFTRSLQRTAGATEAMFLMAAHAFETLRYRRYEWKCNALHERSRRAALRLGFTFEGIFRNHMISKGTQSGYRLVCHARLRVAGEKGRARELARSGELRRRRTSARPAVIFSRQAESSGQ
jgi:RimJ/RimL family protein N-acetyltransferase